MALGSKSQPLKALKWMNHVQTIIETNDRFVRGLPYEQVNCDGLTVGFCYFFVVSRSMRFHLLARHLQDPHSSSKLQQWQEIVHRSLAKSLVRMYQKIIDRMFPLYHGTFGMCDLVPQLFSVGLQPDFSETGLLFPCVVDMLAVLFAVASSGAIIL